MPYTRGLVKLMAVQFSSVAVNAIIKSRIFFKTLLTWESTI